MSVIISTRYVNNCEIHLYRDGKELGVFFKNIASGESSLIKYPIPKGKTIEEEITRNATCEVVLQSGKPLLFTHGVIKLEWESKKLTLIPGYDEILISQLFDTATKNISQCNFFDCTIPSLRCHAETIEVINIIKTRPLGDQISLIKQLFTFFVLKKDQVHLIEPAQLDIQDHVEKYIQKAELDQAIIGSAGIAATAALGLLTGGIGLAIGGIALCGGTLFCSKWGETVPKSMRRQAAHWIQKTKEKTLKIRTDFIAKNKPPFIIELEPRNKKSHFDERVLVSPFLWAVTMICDGGWENNHTSIIVEGLNNGTYEGLKDVTIGEYFMQKSDFESTKEINSGLHDLKIGLKHVRRTKSWKISCEKGINLLKNIDMDVNESKNGGLKGYKFALNPGPNEINCVKWAIQNLSKADIANFHLYNSLPIITDLTYRGKNYAELGVAFYEPIVWIRNMQNEHDLSEESIKERESL